jgi:putative tricarboxylic transport membrane protein
VPYALLTPLIVVLCIVGAYAIQNSLLDVALVLIFGVIGFILRKADYPLAPLIVALVLGMPTELTLRQSLIASDGSLAVFFTGSLTLPLMLAAMFLFFLPLIRLVIRRLR